MEQSLQTTLTATSRCEYESRHTEQDQSTRMLPTGPAMLLPAARAGAEAALTGRFPPSATGHRLDQQLLQQASP